MKFFYLPDLGEGIPEADIVKWHVNEGDEVKEDQIIVSVETAKAVVEVPSPVTGTIKALCSQSGDTVLTGEPLVEFVSNNDDVGTVVGELAQEKMGTEVDDTFIIGAAPNTQLKSNPLSMSGLASLADKYRINLEQSGARQTQSPTGHYPLKNPSPLKGVRRHMARIMSASHAEVVPVTLFGDADIYHWEKKEDITVRLIKAIVLACKAEPALNAWFDGATISRELHSSVNLGLAIDSSEGLFVPVIRSVHELTDSALRLKINTLREEVNNRSISPLELQGASITLSNFGVFAGTYATPIIVPPSVCIIGVGRLKDVVVSIKKVPECHRALPLSLSFDHRAATGGEATRFLKTMLDSLEDT
ncbi:MAG: dihydrolipoamide acetyltransferase family protein [Candidatus Endonucleobacter bathymodioli]|uniref:Dihydrolipoamide acetyltransferase component of pyruvate dehydrogenase complex n=1 Tax=Candidatus Endonucleibacter bathymodioli TaxID=539814 RepID=A0AA90NN76_9GAMM|nr:dihydrolipoamide acetyltransferase family protein [Candidatus Endonucleobacter bathymodioli]CAC9656368.1 Dihydrolipoamide acyltransferase component of branched-chain alpha-keto acid dehydrogenase complex (EC 2.3.1.168) [uncultured Gammaproteobacteria bacterium]